MQSQTRHAVTGGLSYIGKHITRLLVERDKQVLVLTGHPDRPNPFGEQVRVAPFSFESPEALCETLRGVTVLFNTYWVRFDYREVSFVRAVAQSRTLFDAAKKAGVQRIVHLSVSNPSRSCPFPYYRGKAEVENALAESGLQHTIIRPTLVFGGQEEILVNNIAWLLRRFPIFALPGGASYRLQPIHVDDVAALALEASAQTDTRVFDAAGPDILTFEDLVRSIAKGINSHSFFIRTSPALALFLLRIVGLLVRDVVLTPDELGALGADLLVSKESPRGSIRFNEWIKTNGQRLGRRYASEMRRHF